MVAALKEVHLPPACCRAFITVFHCRASDSFLKARWMACGKQRAAEPWKRVWLQSLPILTPSSETSWKL